MRQTTTDWILVTQQRHDDNDVIKKQDKSTASVTLLEHHNKDLIMIEPLMHKLDKLISHVVHFETSRHDIITTQER